MLPRCCVCYRQPRLCSSVAHAPLPPPLLNRRLDLRSNLITAGLTNRTSCPLGAFLIDSPSRFGCFLCRPGRWGNSTDLSASSCSGACPAGTYSLAGSGACTSCPAGTYSPAGAGACTSCPAGTYSLAGASECAACPAGTWFDPSRTGLNSSVCGGLCSPGHLCPANTNTAVCSAGHTCLGGSTNATAFVCPAGTYSLAGAASCTLCPAGRYSLVGAGACTSCPVGSPFSAIGAGSASACSACTSRCDCAGAALGATPLTAGASCISILAISHACGLSAVSGLYYLTLPGGITTAYCEMELGGAYVCGCERARRVDGKIVCRHDGCGRRSSAWGRCLAVGMGAGCPLFVCRLRTSSEGSGARRMCASCVGPESSVGEAPFTLHAAW